MNNNNRDPWDMGVYRTGSVEPPKRGNPLVPILLIAVIVLAGVNTLLGIMNVRLSHKLKNQSGQGLSMLMEEESTSPAITPNSTPNRSTDFSLPLQDAPETENVPQSGGISLQTIFENSQPSIVTIGNLSGVVLSADGYIVTSADVTGFENINVRLSDGQTLNAKLIGVDPVTNLAVIQAESTDLTPANFANSNTLRVGDAVCSIGSAMFDGIISAIDGDMGNLIKTTAYQPDVFALINGHGQVVGIGLEGHAVPSITVKNVVDQLISKGFISGSPSLGLTGETVSQLFQNYYNIPAGIYITQIDSGSNAEVQGLEVGDILVSIDSQSITTAEDLLSAIATYRIGDPIEAVIYRNDQSHTVTLIIEEAK